MNGISEINWLLIGEPRRAGANITRPSINNTKSNSIFSLWEWEKLIWLVCWGGWRPSHIENGKEIKEIFDLFGFFGMNNGGWCLMGWREFVCSFFGGLWAVAPPMAPPKEENNKTNSQFQSNSTKERVEWTKPAVKSIEMKMNLFIGVEIDWAGWLVNGTGHQAVNNGAASQSKIPNFLSSWRRKLVDLLR